MLRTYFVWLLVSLTSNPDQSRAKAGEAHRQCSNGIQHDHSNVALSGDPLQLLHRQTRPTLFWYSARTKNRTKKFFIVQNDRGLERFRFTIISNLTCRRAERRPFHAWIQTPPMSLHGHQVCLVGCWTRGATAYEMRVPKGV